MRLKNVDWILRSLLLSKVSSAKQNCKYLLILERYLIYLINKIHNCLFAVGNNIYRIICDSLYTLYVFQRSGIIYSNCWCLLKFASTLYNKVLIESICRIINLALILNDTLLILIAIKTYIRESISAVHMYPVLYSRVISIAVWRNTHSIRQNISTRVIDLIDVYFY